jgi:hypothetical protein
MTTASASTRWPVKGVTEMAKTPMKNNPFDPKQIKWALNNAGGSGAGGIFGAMSGMPWQQKRGNMWMTIDPRMRAVYPSGTTPFGLGGYGGGDAGGNGGGGPQIEKPPLPPFDPNNPNGNGNGTDIQRLLELLKPPPIGTGAQWRNTMKYGA